MPDEQPGTISAEELTAITGLTDRHLRRLATQGHFPQPNHGRYLAGKTLVGYIKYQAELLRKKNGKLAKEQLALTKAKRERQQEELAVLRGEYIERAVIGPALRNVSLHQRAVLQRVLEQELAPNLAGLTPIEVLERMKRAVDTICSTFREGVSGWLDKPPEPSESNSRRVMDSVPSDMGIPISQPPGLIPVKSVKPVHPITNPAPIVTKEPD